jgi:hypothetical protein
MHSWGDTERAVVGVVRAGRRRYVWAERSSLGNVHSGEISDLVAAVHVGALVVGEVDEGAGEALVAAGCFVPAEPLRRRRAGALAAIAWERWSAGSVDDPVALEPIYVHPS